MNLSEHKELYKKAIEKWGPEAQIMIVFEELAELQFAICKSMRPKLYGTEGQKRLDIINEIADVYVMLGQLMLMYDILEIEVEDKVLEKIERLRLRLMADGAKL